MRNLTLPSQFTLPFTSEREITHDVSVTRGTLKTRTRSLGFRIKILNASGFKLLNLFRFSAIVSSGTTDTLKKLSGSTSFREKYTKSPSNKLRLISVAGHDVLRNPFSFCLLSIVVKYQYIIIHLIYGLSIIMTCFNISSCSG